MSGGIHPMQTRPPMYFGGRETDPATRHYRVFISYSHTDTKWADRLMRRLEGYRVPARFHGRAAPLGTVGPRIAPLFRDRDELPTTSDLGETIRTALRESATLVVICSPASAQSRWVREEIAAFKALHGETRVFAFIVAGEPKAAGTDQDCFSPALRFAVDPNGQLSSQPAEVVAADARPQGDGPKLAFMRLVSGLLGVGFDELRQREQARLQHRLTLIAAAAVVGMAVTLGLAATAWQARNDAQRRQEQGEDLLAFMLGDLRRQLEKVGRLDVLESVGEKTMAYIAGLNPRDLTDTSLARHAEALTQIGEIRMAQVRYPEAARAFARAYDSASALAARHPRDGAMLFQRGQAEYWIGFVHWRRGDLPQARTWLERYRDTSVALAALDPARPEWQSELAYGQHNMAVLDLDRSQFDEARAGFLGELATLNRLAGTKLDDSRLQERIADTISYLGSLAERDGLFAEALERYRHQTMMFTAMARAEPGTAKWQERLSNALAMEATVLEITGDRPTALARRREARRLLEVLVARDPTNRAWSGGLFKLRLKEAMLARADGDERATGELLSASLPGLDQLHAAAPTDRSVAGLLATALRLEAQGRLLAGQPGATGAIARAVAISEELMIHERVNDELFGEQLRGYIAAGLVARARGDEAAARGHWQRAADLGRPRLPGSNHWRLLDPAARALALAGRSVESQDIVSRLQRLGYQPLEPWPAAAELPPTGHD